MRKVCHNKKTINRAIPKNPFCTNSSNNSILDPPSLQGINQILYITRAISQQYYNTLVQTSDANPLLHALQHRCQLHQQALLILQENRMPLNICQDSEAQVLPKAQGIQLNYGKIYYR